MACSEHRTPSSWTCASRFRSRYETIADTVGQKDVGQYLGYLGMAMMVGMLIAPLLGGVVFAKAGYDAVFETTPGLISVHILNAADPKGGGSIEAAHAKIEQSTREDDVEDARADGEHQLPATVQGRSPSENTSRLSRPRRRVRLPAVSTLLSSRRLLSALWGTLVEGAIFSGLETVLPLQTQAAFGWGSEGGGLIFLPLTPTAFLGPAVGWFSDKYGPRWPTFVGFLLLSPFLTLLRLIDHDTLHQKVLLCALLTLVGCCFTLTLDPLMAEIAYVVEQEAKEDPERYGSTDKAYAQAFALFNMAFSVGNTVGPLCAGLLREAAGWGTMSWVLGLLGGVTAIPTGLWCGGWIYKQDVRWRQRKEMPVGALNAE